MDFNTEYNSENKEIKFLNGANIKGIHSFTGVSLKVDGDTSDGYHTFNELYHHRMVLFSIICNQNKESAWKSKLHADGTMYDDYFIVGLTTKEGDYTYHYHLDNWDNFDVWEVEKAPEWDGHTSKDITRLYSLL